MTLRTLSGSSLFLSALIFCAAPHAAAQSPDAPHLTQLLEQWNADNGSNWRVATDPQTGFLQMLYGGRADARGTVRADVDADFFVLARTALEETYAMHGIDASTLVPESTLHLPLGIIGSTDKMTVRFRQIVEGVQVEDGFVNVLFDMQGRLLSVQSVGLPHLSGFDVRPRIDAQRATASAIEAFRRKTGFEENSVSEARLIVDQDFDGEQRVARLAWKIDVQAHYEGFDPVGFDWFVDARTGAAYKSAASVHFFDVSGSVTGSASPGLTADSGANPPVQLPIPYMRIVSGAVTTYTDANGNFTLVGVNAPASVTMDYSGLYGNVNNAAGADYSLTTTLTQATGNVVQMAPAASEFTTAQANAYRAALAVRDFIKTTNPSDTHADFVVTQVVNQASSCNASWTGNQTNYYRAGSGCSNFAFSTVVAHEFGHWLNSLYSTNNGSDGMGEGNADVWALYTFDTPYNGQGAYNGSGYVRIGTNTRQFCGDASPGCYGQVHADGEVWMGAAWKIRSRLNTTYGNTIGDQIANSLFLGWMNSYNQTQIKSIIETQWLTLDDDDGNINTGTPHYSQIDLGFRDQGFPGVTLFQVSVDTLTVLPDTTNQTSNYTVSARIVANQNPPLTATQLKYRLNGGAYQTVNMTPGPNDMFTASIPAQLGQTRVEYYVTATNNAASTNVAPQGGANTPVGFDVGIKHIIGSYNFDLAPDNQGWTIGGTGTNEWQRGAPYGKTGTGWSDPGASFSAIKCWGTDLGESTGGSYASNSNTWLRTPIFNCTGASGVHLRFKRWLSVQGSASDQARIRVNGTQIYINGTANMNDGAWIAVDYDISALADNNPSVQIEWNLQANGSTNYGGWNIDDVEVVWIEGLPVPCPPPVNFCTSTANSGGFPASIFAFGTSNISVNNLSLYAQNCPPFTAGIFFYGPNAAQIPFGNGFLCVTGQTNRLPVVFADVFGIATYPLNYNNVPQPISAGQLWRFQFWFRDNIGGQPGFNFSDGLAVTFCP
ncbi:MAG: hypothetical protein JNL28_15620 [Planctomycetes bacterium]|nr:hypothetical protein [Planctomycetota bacterium]